MQDHVVPPGRGERDHNGRNRESTDVTAAATKPRADDLAVDWCGAHALVRSPREAAGNPSLAAFPGRSGQLVVLVSPEAHRHPALESTVLSLLRSTLPAKPGVHTVWVGIPGLGADRGSQAPLVRRILDEFKVDVVAPDGKLAGDPGAGIYVGASIGSAGWRRFHTGSASTVISARFPVPVWERSLPAVPVSESGVVVEPVGAGLLMRGAPAPPLNPGHPAFRVPVDPARPKVIIEGSRILPGQASTLLETIPGPVRSTLLIVPLDPSIVSLGWVSQLAERGAGPVMFSTGVQLVDGKGEHAVVSGAGGDSAFRPFPVALRQSPGSLGQEVLEIAPAPAGWQGYGERAYRLGPGGPVADVVPAGLVLREEPAPESVNAARVPFDPYGWTLTVGVRGHAVTAKVIDALGPLLSAAGADRLRRCRVRIDGELDVADRERIAQIAREAGVTLDQPPAPGIPPVAGKPPIPMSMVSGPRTTSGPDVEPQAEVPPKPEAAPRPDSAPQPDLASKPAAASKPVTPSSPGPGSNPGAGPDPAAPPKSGAAPNPAAARNPGAGPDPSAAPNPAATPNPAAGRRAEPAPRADVPPPPPAGMKPVPPPPPGAPRPPGAPNPPRLPNPMPPGHQVQSGVAAKAAPPPPNPAPPNPVMVTSPGMPVPMMSGPAAETVAVPANAAPARAEPEPDDDVVSATAEPWPERASTSGEQSRFSAAAGNAFTDGLSLVNAALATWPALRRTEAGAKSDYVAVCLYLSRGEVGGVSVNRTLRAGKEVSTEAYMSCLVSGLIRLPIHRRVVLRQAKAKASRKWEVGAVLTDPGFVSASVGYDVTVAGAAADLLIWPATARRTSELVVNRPIDEAVFLPGRRFKILGTRKAEGIEDVDGPTVPPTTVLLRELTTDESDVDRLDTAALARLERAWATRAQRSLDVVDDPDVVLRLTMPMVPA
ncbi:hypothetical protein [Amycolatopsis pithecellobii]|uniref:Uncharacterized protein n=1 Tax=Amycolatopsis pithecellobii TaxID=664692 RepID=A0A6N7Z3R1_9PSEU|nr:hypothetical protein [Amycolatopsis pithecellobii]MTD55819.1 hypothetical protein [Amycolatopsis pithecellobii]